MEPVKYRSSTSAMMLQTIGEINSGEVVTVPDDALSIRQILDSYTTNNIPPIYRQGYYDDDSNDDFDLQGASDSKDITEVMSEFEIALNDIRNDEEVAKEREKKETEEKNLLKEKNSVSPETKDNINV